MCRGVSWGGFGASPQVTKGVPKKKKKGKKRERKRDEKRGKEREKRKRLINMTNRVPFQA